MKIHTFGLDSWWNLYGTIGSELKIHHWAAELALWVSWRRLKLEAELRNPWWLGRQAVEPDDEVTILALDVRRYQAGTTMNTNLQ